MLLLCVLFPFSAVSAQCSNYLPGAAAVALVVVAAVVMLCCMCGRRPKADKSGPSNGDPARICGPVMEYLDAADWSDMWNEGEVLSCDSGFHGINDEAASAQPMGVE
jgi:hypothetical protein